MILEASSREDGHKNGGRAEVTSSNSGARAGQIDVKAAGKDWRTGTLVVSIAHWDLLMLEFTIRVIVG